MCQEMGQLMAQRSINFTRPEFLQSWIKPDMRLLEVSATDGGAHAIVPAYSQTRRQVSGADAKQK